MKMNQEIDAMRAISIDPFDALVFPRFFTLLYAFPLLVFAADVAGMFGGYVGAWAQLGMEPSYYLQRTLDTAYPTNFWIGLSKAPVFAVLIAAIGCHQGLQTGGDTESLGRRVTTSVVHAVYAAILVDAVFAFIYGRLNM